MSKMDPKKLKQQSHEGQGNALKSKKNSVHIGKYIFERVWFPLLFVLIWHLIASLKIYPAFMLPSPIAVLQRGWEILSNGYLLEQIGVSLRRQLIGFILGVIVAIILGLTLGISHRVRTWMLASLRLIYPIPGIAWVPLAILWFGIGDGSIVFVIFLASIWPLLFNTISGIDAINPTLLRASKALGASRMTSFFKVYIPGALPFIISGLRLSYGTSWRNIVGAEIVAASSGLGFMINNARSVLAGDEIIVGMITIGILGFVVEKYLFDYIQKITIQRWGMSNPDV